MNLHGIARRAIGAVNPEMTCMLQHSIGSTTAGSGKRAPAYGPPVQMMAQVQSLSTRDLSQLAGINQGGSTRKIYLAGSADAIVRVSQKGGDLVTVTGLDGAAQVYLVTAVLEQWPDWACVAVTLQAP